MVAEPVPIARRTVSAMASADFMNDVMFPELTGLVMGSMLLSSESMPKPNDDIVFVLAELTTSEVTLPKLPALETAA
ncbi:MAG: hypothetical protein HQL78_01155 [Magnetococcales bacterium]|nr:hypothetical protein [Magnetococcales bacterium]